MPNKISISTSFNYNIPLSEQLALISKAGFNYISLGEKLSHSQILDTDSRTILSNLLTNYNLKIDTIHCSALCKEDTIKLMPAYIEAAKQLEVPVLVIHACPFDFAAEEYQTRMSDILSKLDRIEKMLDNSGVKMAIENVYPGIANQFIQEIIAKSSPDIFGFCYDSSHDQIDGPRSYELLEILKERLLAMHISDRSRPFVDHQIPGEGFIDFQKIIEIVKSTDYNRPLLLEVMMEHSRFKEPNDFLQQAAMKAKEIQYRMT